MAEKIEIRKEAIARQGTYIERRRRRYLIEGDKKRASFQMGAEGLVHYATEEGTGDKYRIKCFWEPSDSRLARSRYLVKQQLATSKAQSIDVLAAAPFDLVEDIGGLSRFALIMKNVEGGSWKDLREDAEQLGEYPPPKWPSVRTRLIWAYGLASAVARMESRGFVHADLSDGNVVVVPEGERRGHIALVDFDAYLNPKHPSEYRGTENFVAPEIWNKGAAGIGSDRVAMSILIQDLLLTGDPGLSADEAFVSKYTQDQICDRVADAHPVLKHRHPQLATLLENTVRARTREERPLPAEWQKALRDILETSRRAKKVWRLDSTPEDPRVRILLDTAGMHDLTQTAFQIHANVLRSEDDFIQLQVHDGAKVLVRPSGTAWRELHSGEKLSIQNDATFFEVGASLQGQLTLDSATAMAPGSSQISIIDSYERAVQAEETGAFHWLKTAADRLDGIFPTPASKRAAFFLLGFLGMLLVMLAILLAFHIHTF